MARPFIVDMRSKTFGSSGAAKRLHLEQLPGYAPDLNPDEGIWNYREAWWSWATSVVITWSTCTRSSSEQENVCGTSGR
jgi:hypothetical protein